jgi:hypothetical protein
MAIIPFSPAARVRLSSSVRYAPMDRWIQYSGLNRAATYVAIARGEIKAKKFGRTLLIDVESGDAHLDGLPDAQISRRQAEPAA